MYDIIYILCTVFLFFLIRNINGGAEGNNHYAVQFSQLFPISWWTFISGGICSIVYFSLLFINVGVFPFGALILKRNALRDRYKVLCDFCVISCIILVFEIVFLIVLTEEGVPTIPHKFLFRYFQVLVPLVLMIFTRDIEEEEFFKNKRMWLLSGVCFTVCLCYFRIMQGNTRQAIMDGYLYLTLENTAKYVFRYLDVVVVALAGIATTFLIRLAYKGREKIVRKFLRLGTVGIILFWMLNCIQLPVYTNLIADGKTIQSDSIKIADYLNEVECDLYYLTISEEDEAGYLRNFYGYVRQTYQVIGMEELDQILSKSEESESTYILVPSKYLLEKEGMEMIDLQTERLSLYLLSASIV